MGKSRSYTKKQTLLFIILLCFVGGVILGVVACNSMDQPHANKVITDLEEYYSAFLSITDDAKLDMFIAGAFKYFMLVLVIWLLAFVPAGGFIAFILILIKGVQFGFTSTLIISEYGAMGLFNAALLYLPQCLIMLPAYCYLTYNCVNYILYSVNTKKDKHRDLIKQYTTILALGLVLSLATSFADSYILTSLMS